VQEAFAPVPNGTPVSKVEKCKWSPLDKQGKFQLVNKDEVNVDHAYQRDKVSQRRALDIARDFSWSAFGVLLCVRRDDATIWVYDGQHRKLAADKRSDVQKLPCFIFDSRDVKQEAKAFLLSNTVRGSMASLDKYKALIVCEDEIAVGVREMVKKTGHTIGSGGFSCVKCICLLMRAYALDPDCLRKTWPIAARIAGDKHVTDSLVKAVFTTERMLYKTQQGSLLSKQNSDSIAKLTLAEFEQSLQKTSAYFGRGEKSCARALIDCLNYRRTKNRIDIDKAPENA